jgi:hypothetical protein
MLFFIAIHGGWLIMMGQHARSESLFYYFRIEDQVPENHLLRLIDRHICFAGFGTDGLRCEEAMKTAGRENPNRWATLASNRAPGAGGQNRSCSIKWAEKQENVQPLEGCFFLTSPFIELTRSLPQVYFSLRHWLYALALNIARSETTP